MRLLGQSHRRRTLVRRLRLSAKNPRLALPKRPHPLHQPRPYLPLHSRHMRTRPPKLSNPDTTARQVSASPPLPRPSSERRRAEERARERRSFNLTPTNRKQGRQNFLSLLTPSLHHSITP